MRIAELILRNEGPEAQGKMFLAFSLKSGAGGRSSNLYQGNTYPLTHHSSIPLFQCSIWHKALEFLYDQLVTKVLPEKPRKLVDFGPEIG